MSMMMLRLLMTMRIRFVSAGRHSVAAAVVAGEAPP